MEYLSSFRLTSKRLFRSFVSLLKYCDLCNNSTSHQLGLKQVPCTALMITGLVSTLACCVLERSAKKSLLWTQNAVSSLTSVQAQSKQISVCQEIVTSFRSRKPSGLYRANPPPPPIFTFPENFSIASKNLSSQT